MSGKTEKAKGRIKEAMGTLTGRNKLANSGRADQSAGNVKDKVTGAVDKVKDTTTRH
jgi:uncharacterized protein YjbJ (UPF0337 family)